MVMRKQQLRELFSGSRDWAVRCMGSVWVVPFSWVCYFCWEWWKKPRFEFWFTSWNKFSPHSLSGPWVIHSLRPSVLGGVPGSTWPPDKTEQKWGKVTWGQQVWYELWLLWRASKVQEKLEPYMLGKVGGREDCRWENSLTTIFAGYLVERKLCIRADRLRKGCRSIRKCLWGHANPWEQDASTAKDQWDSLHLRGYQLSWWDSLRWEFISLMISGPWKSPLEFSCHPREEVRRERTQLTLFLQKDQK